jgi:ergothioneine biosynthesis protein EgtB
MTDRDQLRELYRSVRRQTLALAEPLTPEDCIVQTMPDVSPTKWHLAHTTWFFETFVLARAVPAYRPIDEAYAYLYNSYYHTVGAQYPRHERGFVSRPSLSEVIAYRRHVDGWMERVLGDAPEELFQAHAPVLEVGINHEEQHQELILTDIKHVLAANPLEPRYRETPERPPASKVALGYASHAGGLVELGDAGGRFAFDNERPRHRVHVEPFALADRLVTAGEYLEFMQDGGYARPSAWLSDGWAARQRAGWQAPLYWQPSETGWRVMTLGGARLLDPLEPVCHVSYYEADAFATWAGARLPRESEWELFGRDALPDEGNFVETGELHPLPIREQRAAGRATQLFGDVWEWTASAYAAYPGFSPLPGALGEYNGKFMCNQLVLRGGSCVSPRRHLRETYRNFFPPDARWQFSGIRLAK